MSYWLQSLDQNGPTASSQRVTQISKCPVSVKPKHCTHATCINDYTFPLLFSWMILYLCFFKRNFKYWLPRGQCSAVPPRVQQHLCILLMFFFLLECWVLNWICDCGNKLLSLTLVFTSVLEPIQWFPLQCHPHFNTVLFVFTAYRSIERKTHTRINPQIHREHQITKTHLRKLI